jgi:hypothetical protein
MGKHLKSPPNGTPDERMRGNRDANLAMGGSAHDMGAIIRGATDIARSPNGPACRLDKPHRASGTDAEASLGAGGGRLGDAAASIKSGARTQKADFAFLRKG